MEIAPTSDEPSRDGHSLQDLVAKIVQLEETVTRLDDNQKHLQQTNKQLSAKFEEHCHSFLSLRHEHNCLQAKHTKLREGHTGLQDDHTSLETAHRQLRIDHRKLEQTLAELKLYLSTFQEEHQQVLDDHSLLKKEQEKLVTTVTNIRFEQPKPLPQAGELLEVPNDAEKETASTEGGEMTSQSHDLTSDEDRGVQQKLSADLHRLSSDLRQLGNDCSELHTEMTELRILQGELVRKQNNLQITNRPEMKQGGREEQDTFQERLMNLQKEHIDTVLAEQRNMEQRQASERKVLWKHVEEMVTSLQESQNKTTHALTVLETRLRGAKQLFYTRDLNTSRASHGEAMTFNTVLVEEGGHYNHQTGVFTAPQAGLYFFIATIESRFRDTAVFCRIMADHDIQCVVQGGYFGGSGCVLVPLTTGQKVWLVAYDPSARHDCWSSNGSFSGTLVVPFQENPGGRFVNSRQNVHAVLERVPFASNLLK